jgi:hypothetical protein
MAANVALGKKYINRVKKIAAKAILIALKHRRQAWQHRHQNLPQSEKSHL